MSSALTIFITGANQGLGFEAAKLLSKCSNVRLFIGGRRANAIKEAVEAIRTAPGCVAKVEDGVIIDISRDDSIKAAVADVEKRLGPDAGLDVLVNNAAIVVRGKRETHGLRAVLEETYAVNVFGTACTSDLFLPLLKKSTAPNCPRVVNVSSTRGSLTITTSPEDKLPPSIYEASKTALNALTSMFAKENPGIHAVSICPGFNRTNLNNFHEAAAVLEGGDGPKTIADFALEKKGKSGGYYNKDGELPW